MPSDLVRAGRLNSRPAFLSFNVQLQQPLQTVRLLKRDQSANNHRCTVQRFAGSNPATAKFSPLPVLDLDIAAIDRMAQRFEGVAGFVVVFALAAKFGDLAVVDRGVTGLF